MFKVQEETFKVLCGKMTHWYLDYKRNGDIVWNNFEDECGLKQANLQQNVSSTEEMQSRKATMEMITNQLCCWRDQIQNEILTVISRPPSTKV